MKLLNLALLVTAGVVGVRLVNKRIYQRNLQSLKGKTYVVIGASSGFGKGVALKLGQYGANVVIAARRDELLSEVADKINGFGGKALVVPLDISDKEAIENLRTRAIDAFGNIDGWINNSGVYMVGRFWEIPIDEQSKLIDVNLKGYLYGTYAAATRFIDQGYGTIVNVGSIDSEIPMAYNAAYASTKAAIRSMSQAINQEFRLAGFPDIRVVTIEPWAVDTPLWQHAVNYTGGTPRQAAMDDPSKVVDAIIRSLFTRKQEVPVGWKSATFFHFHRLFPHTSERMSADLHHRYQYENAPPARNTSGNLHRPMKSGTGIDDNNRERIRQEELNRV